MMKAPSLFGRRRGVRDEVIMNKAKSTSPLHGSAAHLLQAEETSI